MTKEQILFMNNRCFRITAFRFGSCIPGNDVAIGCSDGYNNHEEKVMCRVDRSHPSICKSLHHYYDL